MALARGSAGELGSRNRRRTGSDSGWITGGRAPRGVGTLVGAHGRERGREGEEEEGRRRERSEARRPRGAPTSCKGGTAVR